MKYKDLLAPYNPWWEESLGRWTETLPDFHRPVFSELFDELNSIPQILSITGPRRVGKSTIIRQMILRLLKDGVAPARIVYFSMDDPALYRTDIDQDAFFDSLMDYARGQADGGRTYFFLDEIHRFNRWELFLKKYYDLKYPVRFVVSGSASSPIFRASRESLLGRIKDFHILPFSFREYLLYKYRDDAEFVRRINDMHSFGSAYIGMISKNPEHAELPPFKYDFNGAQLEKIESSLNVYMIEGGFPEVWGMRDLKAKQEYLFDNQVEKVITEDLIIAFEFRKPEKLKRFYISLLEKPGREMNLQTMSKELGIDRATIEKYFPMLEMTDLLRHIENFTNSPLRVRRGNIKCYPVDLALRNAVLRIGPELLEDPAIMGLYAETLVFNTIAKWKGILGINYMRKDKSEIDFIVHLNANDYLPIEVKYRETFSENDIKTCEKFAKEHNSLGIIVTKNIDNVKILENLLFFPLPEFLIMFD